MSEMLLVCNTPLLLVLRHFGYCSCGDDAARTNNQVATVRNVVGVRRKRTPPLLVLRHFGYCSCVDNAARTNNQMATVRNVVGVRRKRTSDQSIILRNTQQRRGMLPVTVDMIYT